MNDYTNQSADDALAPKDDVFNPLTDVPHLAEDNDPPAAPADDTGSKPTPSDHPQKDSNIDTAELYDEGETSAAELDSQEENPEEPR